MSLRDARVRKPSTRANTSGAVCGGSAMGKETSSATDSASRNSIREFKTDDIEAIVNIHEQNGLPDSCLPDVLDPLCLVKLVVESEGRITMASVLRGTAELFLFVDHTLGTPEERWQTLQELTAAMKREAWLKGLDQMSAWLPPEIEASFGKRMEQLGFEKSKWSCYTMTL